MNKSFLILALTVFFLFHLLAKLTEEVVLPPRLKKKKKKIKQTPKEPLRIHPVCFGLLLQEMLVK